MTCPRCKCPECRRVELQAVLARVGVSRETETVDEVNARLLRLNRDRERWNDTVETGRRFAEPRKLGEVPVDADAEQLAGEVGALAGELARGVA